MHVPAHTPKKHDGQNKRIGTVAGISSEKEEDENWNGESQSDKS